MPDLDEDTLRQLMFLSTDDLFASPLAATAAVKRQRRRHLRNRAVGAVGTAAAAGLAAGVLASGTGPATSGGGHSASGGLQLTPGGTKSSSTPIRLTAAQRALFSLSAAAAKTPRPSGRYVVLREIATTKGNSGGATSSEIGGKTSVIDTITGGGVTYQDITVSGDAGPTPPGVLNAPAGSSPTVAQLDALPTNPAALRATLLSQAEQQLRQAQQELNQELKKSAKLRAVPVPLYRQTPGELVLEQATNLLWEPDLSPQLRSAIYQVLAATPGVVVSTGVKDSSGRPATEISGATSPLHGDTAEVFEDPATGATLESAWTTNAGGFFEDLYLKITYTSTIPADPYNG
jgi:hypothetical protein